MSMQKVTRLKDVAEGLGVSITTVSKALNNHPDISDKRKKEILDYVQKVHYIPNQVAKNFRQQKTKMIGIIVSNNANPYYARVIKGIEEVLTKAGYYAVIMNSHEDVQQELQLINQLVGLNVAGILLVPAAGNKESRKILKKYEIPYVFINRYLRKNDDQYVVLDDVTAGYLATKHLCQYGNEKIFLLNYLQHVSSAVNRLKGYKCALKEENMTCDSENVFWGCMGQEEGYEAMKRILETEKKPISVVCYSDYVAMGAMCAIQERGYKVPHDVAIVGTDDVELLSFVKPRLTTVAVPKLRLGKRSAQLLLELLETGADETEGAAKESRHVVMKPELIVRETA